MTITFLIFLLLYYIGVIRLPSVKRLSGCFAAALTLFIKFSSVLLRLYIVDYDLAKENLVFLAR